MAGKKHLVLIGAGHAHLETIAALGELVSDGYDVTVINPGTYQYYSGMGPGMLGGFYKPGEVRFNIRRMVESRGARFEDAAVVRIDADNRTLELSTRESVPYDVLSCNVGSEIDCRSLDTSGSRIITVKPVEHLFRAHCAIRNELQSHTVRIVVIGAGPAGVEMAANSIALGNGSPNNPDVTLVTRGKLLMRFPPRVQRKARKKLEESGVRTIENARVVNNTDRRIELDGLPPIPFDYAFVATGTKPPSLFIDSHIPCGDTGGLLVGNSLNSPSYPEVFGGGDCIDFEARRLVKVGVYAVRENPILKANLRRTLERKPLLEFKPQKVYHLILNMGDGTGISWRRPFLISGKPAFRLKDTIDGKFMRRFQESGEPAEKVPCPEN